MVIEIPYVNLRKQWQDEKNDLLVIIDRVLSTGQHVGGEEIEKFENEIANICKVNHAVALNSGTDALILALRAAGVGPNDEVITPPNSFIASTSAIASIGATPVFVDVLPDQNINPDLIEPAITDKTKAIMPVHLTGRMCQMEEIMDISHKYNLYVIEDAAQAIRSEYNQRPSGSIGHVGCFSTHPLKNLNACGDGGFITTNDQSIFTKIKSLRNHGMIDRSTIKEFGTVSRMDNLQAAILNYRLQKLDGIIKKRRENAKKYFLELDFSNIFVPAEKQKEYNTYHTFVIQTDCRDQLKKHLLDSGIETAIHYPIPIHLQLASRHLGYQKGSLPVAERQAEKILTLPINQSLQFGQIEKIISSINGFFS